MLTKICSRAFQRKDIRVSTTNRINTQIAIAALSAQDTKIPPIESFQHFSASHRASTSPSTHPSTFANSFPMDETTTTTTPPILLTLLQSFPTAVHTPNSPTYPPLNAAFWNLDNALTHPLAILTPSTASETALLLSHLATTRTPFAIRSGGYAPLHNTSPSLLLSTSRLTALSLNSDDTVSIGAGLTWGAVYDFLTPHGLVVPGARARPVGVAGFLLHGGISHFYAEAGWACEAVVAFEVALADGRVVRAAAGGEHAELYWALKGGGKNFGVVTAFTMRTRRLGRMWGGQRVVRGGEGVAERVLGEVHALHGERGEENEKAHAEVIAVFDPSVCEGGEEMFVLQLAWAGEEGGEVEALKGFREGECVVDGTRWTTQGELAGDDGSFVGFDKR